MSQERELQDLRLLFYCPSLGDGGAERTWALLAGDAAARGARVALAVDGAVSRGVAPPQGVEIVELGGRRAGHVGQMRALRRLLKRFAPHVALSAIGASPLKLALAASGMREVALVHAFHGLEEWRSGRLTHLAWRALPWLARRGRIVAVSDALRDVLVHRWGVPAQRIRRIHNPVMLPEPLPKVTVPELAARDPVIVATGRLAREKQFGMAIRALSLMHHDEAKLVLVGEGPQRKALQYMVAQLGLEERVTFAGWQSDVWPHLHRAKVFCLPSRTESFGIAAVEALAAGLPVIGTATTGLREVIGNDPRLGQLVEITDVEALAAELDAALDDPGCPGPRQARAREFAASRILPQWRALMMEMAGK